MRRIASLLVAGAMSVVAGAGVAVAPPPITLSLSWAGEPCNAAGLVDVSVTNVSGRELVMPKNGWLGYGGLFIGAARVGRGRIVTSDNFLPPPPPVPRGQVREVRRLAPGQSTTYRVEIDQSSNGMSEGSPHFALDTAYRKIRRSKGQLWLIYALSHAPDANEPYVVAAGGDEPLIRSNGLYCPA
ncbi:MAG: hypothetical protein Q8L23_04525 [Caulobacter sp.]|nr:hypothetical protein [Caulobacter sp.]